MPLLRTSRRAAVDSAAGIAQRESPTRSGRAMPPRRRGRWALVTLGLAAIGGAGWLLGTRSTKTTTDAGPSLKTFGQVVRTDLQATTDLTGRVAYESDRTVVNRLGGREG